MSLYYYASIELDNVTLYVGNSHGDAYRDVSASKTHFKPYLKLGTLRQKFQAIDNARELPGVLSVDIVNENGWLDQYLGFGTNNEFWDNRVVTIKHGAGDFDSAMTTEFKGRIRRSTLEHTEKVVSFQLWDIRNDQDKPILTNRFDIANHPDAEEKARGKYIPIIYGDFTVGGAPQDATAGSIGDIGRLPAYCIDLTATTAYPFKVADHAITDLTVFHYDDSANTWSQKTLTTDYTVDLANGEFTLTSSFSSAFDAERDLLTVDCKGINAVPGVSGGGATTLEFAADIIYHLLDVYGGATPATDIDSTSFASAHTNSDQHNNRRWIGEQESVMEAAGKIAFENNLQLFVSSDKYNLVFDVPPITTTATITETNLETKGAQSIYDPEGNYANSIIFLGDSTLPDTTNSNARGSARVSGTETNIQAETLFGDTITRALSYEWLYLASNVLLQVQRRLLVYSSKAHNVIYEISDREVTQDGTFWNLALSNIVAVTVWQYTDTPTMIREITKDYNTGRVKIRALATQDAYPLSTWSDAPPVLSALPAVWTNEDLDFVPAGRWF